MENLADIKDYVNKILKKIQQNADFKFLGNNLVKRRTVDDLVCCIIAKLPDEYNKKMQTASGRYVSMGNFAKFQSTLRQKCWWSSSSYWIKISDAEAFGTAFLNSLPRDLKRLEEER